MIQRLSKKALQQILSGQIREEAICVIKFYANKCPYCHNLSESYKKIADEYPDLHFFAFNIHDYPQAEEVIEFSGVPTIVLVKTGSIRPKIRVIPEPPPGDSNKKTWYHIEDIKNFINKEK
jgi:thiol-disulfide isomerase/thioredoxin